MPAHLTPAVAPLMKAHGAGGFTPWTTFEGSSAKLKDKAIERQTGHLIDVGRREHERWASAGSGAYVQ
jgi:hypothetical protein